MLWLYALVPAESETPGTQITSTITSSYMITITSSCRPDVADCPDGTVTQYGCALASHGAGVLFILVGKWSQADQAATRGQSSRAHFEKAKAQFMKDINPEGKDQTVDPESKDKTTKGPRKRGAASVATATFDALAPAMSGLRTLLQKKRPRSDTTASATATSTTASTSSTHGSRSDTPGTSQDDVTEKSSSMPPTKKLAVLDEAKRLCMSNCIFALTMSARTSPCERYSRHLQWHWAGTLCTRIDVCAALDALPYGLSPGSPPKVPARTAVDFCKETWRRIAKSPRSEERPLHISTPVGLVHLESGAKKAGPEGKNTEQKSSKGGDVKQKSSNGKEAKQRSLDGEVKRYSFVGNEEQNSFKVSHNVGLNRRRTREIPQWPSTTFAIDECHSRIPYRELLQPPQPLNVERDESNLRNSYFAIANFELEVVRDTLARRSVSAPRDLRHRGATLKMKSAAPVDLLFRPDDLRVPPRLTSGPAAMTTPDVPGSERHQVCHECQCRVAGCKCGNTTFPNVTALGKHLVSEHNRGKIDACYWPACSHRHNRASSNHRLHLRLHNLAVPTEHRVVFDPPPLSMLLLVELMEHWVVFDPPPDIKLEEDSTDSSLSGESDEDGS
ncbi:hypothetical protein E8E14_002605 [Neopestalotiopsis sp. 37M]|nr:hypothetical protein E8E14_002605 [Neopestalotiopsis sp. 37M]